MSAIFLKVPPLFFFIKRILCGVVEHVCVCCNNMFLIIYVSQDVCFEKSYAAEITWFPCVVPCNNDLVRHLHRVLDGLRHRFRDPGRDAGVRGECALSGGGDQAAERDPGVGHAESGRRDRSSALSENNKQVSCF